MNTFLTICLIVLPLSLLMGFAAYLARQSAKGMPVKRTLSLNITAFVGVLPALAAVWLWLLALLPLSPLLPRTPRASVRA